MKLLSEAAKLFTVSIILSIFQNQCEGVLLNTRVICSIPKKLEGCAKTDYNINDTFIFLYTRMNPIKPEFLHECGRDLPKNSNFDSKYPTEIFIHGFDDGVCIDLWMKDAKNELLKRDNYNVILIDWNIQGIADYFDTMQYEKVAAKQIAGLINNIKLQTGVNGDSFHLVGHSLGAHVAGLIGQRTPIGRITGLDPAGPSFYNRALHERLDRNDAKYVDIIHVNSGRCIPYNGYLYPIGDEDFYVNDGIHQFSCISTSLENMVRNNYRAAVFLALPSICFHTQVRQYYITSINPENCEFVGKRCKTYKDALAEKCNLACNEDGSDCSVMGMNWINFYQASQKEQRIYNVKVSLKCPFCIQD